MREIERIQSYGDEIESWKLSEFGEGVSLTRRNGALRVEIDTRVNDFWLSASGALDLLQLLKKWEEYLLAYEQEERK